MPVYFTNDHHFGQAAARTFYRRLFARQDGRGNDRSLEFCGSPWNVDEIRHPGDFAVHQTAERVAHLLTMLHGRKHLIVGNNDDAVVTRYIGWPGHQAVKV